MQNDEKLRYNKYGLIFKILHDRYNAFSYEKLMYKGHAKLIKIHRTNINRSIEEIQDDDFYFEI